LGEYTGYLIKDTASDVGEAATFAGAAVGVTIGGAIAVVTAPITLPIIYVIAKNGGGGGSDIKFR
jgi:hypothetical protein